MNENLVIGLILAFVSGITFVAYKHPELYEKVFASKLIGVSVFILAWGISYDSGASSAFQAISPSINPDKLDAALKTLEAAKFSTDLFQGALGLLVYSLFLSWLADHFKKEHKNRESDNAN